MTVQELIEKLRDLPAKALVVMAKDSEGNVYSPLSDIAAGVYVADDDCAWEGDFYELEEATEAEIEGQPCVCLWPTN